MRLGHHPPAPITQCDDGVLIQGAALPLLYRATVALIARRSRGRPGCVTAAAAGPHRALSGVHVRAAT